MFFLDHAGRAKLITARSLCRVASAITISFLTLMFAGQLRADDRKNTLAQRLVDDVAV